MIGQNFDRGERGGVHGLAQSQEPDLFPGWKGFQGDTQNEGRAGSVMVLQLSRRLGMARPPGLPQDLADQRLDFLQRRTTWSQEHGFLVYKGNDRGLHADLARAAV